MQNLHAIIKNFYCASLNDEYFVQIWFFKNYKQQLLIFFHVTAKYLLIISSKLINFIFYIFSSINTTFYHVKTFAIFHRFN